ncbi:MAG: TonB-dependent receptor [Chlorobiaceae bacterium]|nr:TonB-dependent receptor [Chlorobiaceae bacterium]MBA4309480.1 TonB-dependent receptor [Chlorobiaceae bacterium]
MKTSLLLLLLVLINSTNFSQTNRGIISGRVIDKSTKQPIPFASVVVVETQFGAASNFEGEFKIENLPPNTYRLSVSAIGYNTVTKTDISVSNVKPSIVDFELQESTIELEGVTVTSDYFAKDPTQIGSVSSFGYEEIRRAPGGFEDVIRALSVLPGVAQAEAGRNDLIVRGGAPSENLFIVEGIEVSNINHFGTQGATGGPLSFINLDFVNQTTFSTGAFPVMFGDKLSSVLKIDLREGRNDRLGGKATISASQFGLNLEGPTSENSNLLFSLRRSYLDFIFKAAGFGFVPEYWDLLTKFNWDLDNKNSISYIYVGALNNVRYFNDTEDQRYDNSRILGSDQLQYMTGLTYRHLFNNGFARLIFSRTHVDFNTSQRDSLLNPIFKNESLEAENRIKAEVIYNPLKTTEITFGGDVKFIKFNADIFFPNFKTTFGEILPINSIKTKNNFLKYSSFLNVSQGLSNRISMNLGIRFDHFNQINNKNYFSPRFSASYLFSDKLSFNFSTGIFYQFPSYIWLATGDLNKNLSAIRVNQFVLGTDFKLRDDTQIKLETYYKDYNDYPTSLLRPYLVLANTGAGYSGSEDNFSSFGLEPLVSAGSGFARGIELSIQKKLSDIPFYGIMSLTLNESKFIGLDGIQRAGSYDQRFIFNISGGYKINEEWEASAKFRYASGRPWTPFNSDGTQSISLFNSERLQPMHSLDLRLDKRWFYDNFTLITYIDIQNVYGRNNSNLIRWDQRTQSTIRSSSIGILPSIGVSLEF